MLHKKCLTNIKSLLAMAKVPYETKFYPLLKELGFVELKLTSKSKFQFLQINWKIMTITIS